MGLLKYLFISICILWIIRQVVRLLLPMIFQSLVKKATHQAQQQQREPQTRQTEGGIRVDFVPPKDREARAADKAGEFIDYEEL